MNKWAFSLLAMLVIWSACDQADDTEAIERLAIDLGAALTAGDPDGLGAAFTEDAVFVRAGAPVATGREAIISRYADDLRYLDFNISVDVQDTRQRGDIAVQHGTFKGSIDVKTDDATLPLTGEFMHVARRQDTGWRLWRATWSFENPVAEGKSCPSASSCCCKSISANDCIVTSASNCPGTDRPIPIVTP